MRQDLHVDFWRFASVRTLMYGIVGTVRLARCSCRYVGDVDPILMRLNSNIVNSPLANRR